MGRRRRSGAWKITNSRTSEATRQSGRRSGRRTHRHVLTRRHRASIAANTASKLGADRSSTAMEDVLL